MLIGPLAFLLLAGVVVMFDPLMVMGKPDWIARRAQARRPGPRPSRTPAAAPAPRPRHEPGPPRAPAPRRTADRSPLSVGGRTVDAMRPVSKIERTVAPFEVVSPYQPSGDQPAAIAELDRRIRGR